MKDPSDEHRSTSYTDYMGEPLDICGNDGELWPCPTVRKWRQSKEFRIQELDTLTDMLAKNVGTLENKIAKLERDARLAQATLKALLNAHADYHGQTSIDINTETDYVDVTDALLTSVRRVPTRTVTTVTYKDMEWQV